MYRKPPVSDDPPPPAAFSYEGREQRQGLGVAIVQLLSLPLGIGAILAAAFSPPIGLAGLVVSGFVVYRWLRPQPERTLFRVERGVLHLRVGDAKAPLEVPLDEVENVVLDTKTVQRTIEGDSAIPAMRAIETKAGLEVDEARI